MSTKEKNPRRFLTDQIAHYKRLSAKSNLPFEIDLDYLEAVWNSQNGRCAITGIALGHNKHSLYAVRLDIIDHTKGFVKGNIQLICDGVKRMRKDSTNEKVAEFINDIKAIMKI